MLKKIFSPVLLMFAAMIWGSAYIAQSEGMKYIHSFTYLFLRSLIAFIVLLTVIIIMRIIAGKKDSVRLPDLRTTVLVSILCGTVLFIASLLQQYGIEKGCEPGKTGFICSFYILLVPVLSRFVLKRKVCWTHWVCIGFALFGLFLLCVKQDLTVETCDLYIVASSFFFSLHILSVSYSVKRIHPIYLSCFQFLVVSLWTFLPAVLCEKPTFPEIQAGWVTIVYAGFFSSGIAYTLQVIAQKNINSSLASIIMSLEASFALLFSLLWDSSYTPTGREWVGFSILFVSVILALLPIKKPVKKT